MPFPLRAFFSEVKIPVTAIAPLDCDFFSVGEMAKSSSGSWATVVVSLFSQSTRECHSFIPTTSHKLLKFLT